MLDMSCWAFTWHRFHKAEKRCGVQERRLQRQLRQELESIRRLFEEADSEPWMGKSPLVIWSDEHKMVKWFDVHRRRHVMKFEEDGLEKGQ